MSELPLFYSSVTPVDSQRHRAFRIRPAEAPFAFAKGAQFIPALAEEFISAARQLPVVFLRVGKRFAPVFLCGVRSGRNEMVDGDGKWGADYVPAYLRRYPFVMGEREGADPIVCIDTSFAGFSEEGEGERLFDDEGKQTAHMGTVVQIVADYAQAAKRTESFVSRLDELDLFKSVNIDIRRPGAGEFGIHGLAMIDEAKLAKLPAEDFIELRDRGYLQAIYAHLMSMGAVQVLSVRMQNAGAENAA